MARRVKTVGYCFGFYPTLAKRDVLTLPTFEFHMTREQAFEFAAVLLVATQQAKPRQTIRATIFRKQKQRGNVFPIQVGFPLTRPSLNQSSPLPLLAPRAVGLPPQQLRQLGEVCRHAAGPSRVSRRHREPFWGGRRIEGRRRLLCTRDAAVAATIVAAPGFNFATRTHSISPPIGSFPSGLSRQVSVDCSCMCDVRRSGCKLRRRYDGRHGRMLRHAWSRSERE